MRAPEILRLMAIWTVMALLVLTGTVDGTAKAMNQTGMDGEAAKRQAELNHVRSSLVPGLSRPEAIKRFGIGYKEVVHPYGEFPMWRYDYAEAGYQYPTHTTTQTANMAIPDLDGLANGSLHMQLFLGWDKRSRQTTYSELYYTEDGPNGRTIVLYRVHPDGTVSEEAVPYP